MTQRLSILVPIGIALFSFTAFGDSGNTLFERGRNEYFTAKKTPSKTIKEKGLFKAASILREFVEVYPSHNKTPDALFDLGSLYQELSEMTGDRDAATRGTYFLKELVQKHSRSSLADDALFKMAQICRSIFKDTKCAEDTLQKIRTDYPKGDIAQLIQTPASNAPAEITEMDMTETPSELLLHFSLTAKKNVVGKIVSADTAQNLPERFYFDLDQVKIKDGINPSKIFSSDSPISQIRYGKNENSLRIVLDLAKNASAEKISADILENGFTIHVPKPNAPLASIQVETPPTQIVKEIPTNTESFISEMETPRKVGRRKIVLDAGHGGEDPGARGKRGTEEKDICLAIVKKVEELLRKRPEYDLFLTRKEDVFIPLAKRTSLANEWGGELFVSIHANASPRREADGISTYFLDNHDDQEALRVAERENAEPGVVFAQPQKATENQYLEIMKASMVKNFHTVQSTDFAQFVQSNILKELRGNYSGINDLGVKSARFFVLTGARMPSILVETSFISNPQEERRLADSRYQNLIAKAVVKGIDAFFKSSGGKGDHAALFQK